MSKQSKYEVYALITGAPFMDRILAYESEYMKVYEKFAEFTDKYDGETFFSWRKLSGLRFPHNKVPDGWTKPKDSRRFSRPKKGTPMLAEMEALPSFPDPYAVYGPELPLEYSYEGTDGSKGVGSFTYRAEPPIIWTKGEPTERKYFLMPIDVAAFLKVEAVKHPERIYSEPLRNWTWPEGLQRLTEAEYELADAQARVDYEKNHPKEKDEQDDE